MPVATFGVLGMISVCKFTSQLIALLIPRLFLLLRHVVCLTQFAAGLLAVKALLIVNKGMYRIVVN